MVDLRSRTHGAGATQGVNLVVMAFDDRIVTDGRGLVITRYLDARVHPGDRRAPGETNLALVSKKHVDPGHRNSACYSADEFASIERAAGDNTTDLTDATGAVVGRVYGVRADLLINNGEVVVNTKTVAPTDLSVGPDAHGSDIRSQMVASTDAAKRARAVARGAAVLVPADVGREHHERAYGADHRESRGIRDSPHIPRKNP